MASSLVSRNITVAGRRTSMRLEPEMWGALSEICWREGVSTHDVCSLVDSRRRASSLTAALRVFIMDYFRAASTEDGHVRAGHGCGLAHRAEPPAPPHREPHAQGTSVSERAGPGTMP